MCAAEAVAFAEEAVERVEFQVGGGAGEVVGDGDDGQGLLDAFALQDADLDGVAGRELKGIGEGVGEHKTVRGKGEGVAVGIGQALEGGGGGEAVERDAAGAGTDGEFHRHAAKRFGEDNAGQGAQVGKGAERSGFLEGDGDGLALHDVPLEIEHVADAVAEGAGHDEDGGGEGEGGGGEGGLEGFAGEVAQGHAEGHGGVAGGAETFQQTGAKIGGRLGAHGLGGGEAGDAAHGDGDAYEGGAGAGGGGGEDGSPRRDKGEVGETEKEVIHGHDFVAEEEAADGSEGGAGGDDEQGEFQVVETYDGVGVAEGLEHGDLFALQGDKAGQHGVGHEGGDAEENEGEAEREAAQDVDLVGDAAVARVAFAVVGTEAAPGFEQAVEVGDKRGGACAGAKQDGELVECAVEIEGLGEGFFAQPENAEGAGVGQRGAGRGLEDVVRGEHDADDAEGGEAAVEEKVNRIAGFDTTGFGEGFADEDLVGGGEGEGAAGAEHGAVEERVAAVGQGVDEAGGGFEQTGDVEGDADAQGGFDGGDAGQGCDLGGEGGRGAFEGGEEIAEALIAVVGIAGVFQRAHEAAGHDHHGQAAGHDEGDGEELGAEGAGVAEKL